MWQESTFDEPSIRRELAWAAGLGFNVCRVYLHDLLWEQDSDGFLRRIGVFLDHAHQNGIGAIFVLFDDVWCSEPKLGRQPDPHPGRHNSGWVQSPGLPTLHAYPNDRDVPARLEAYVHGIVSAFANDPRVLTWDVYNEPGGYPSPLSDPVGEACLPLLRDAFDWARGASPSQPLTSGLWSVPTAPLPPAIEALQLELSDIVSFHHYGPADALERLCEHLRSLTDRPLLCTEYLARNLESRFETHLPVFRERGIGAISWGLVSGKTQTVYPWWSWFDDEPEPEPKIWFHDILRPDGNPFDPNETAFLRHFLRVREGTT
ncbi:MAG: 1,4-beta-xylanase [Myxococcota bacterium]|jgi:hypothetical protein|nr:1,4-beta-xylanase [Myxococcota bacterium]MDP6241740.1 1,4-beta-xylanase [Myxococcota bacterium]MDP7073879.1 1,4-beta-xylanase [Myxococcota bacterium]MDP7300392.1 1,4-beta-xylanase [Myxococcota bacterium]MDP7433328.1 1,4-beta-xylanase [Myxococcota bacterium]